MYRNRPVQRCAVQGDEEGGGLRSVFHAQPMHRLREVVADRVAGEVQPLPDLAVRVAGRDQLQDQALPLGEAIQKGAVLLQAMPGRDLLVRRRELVPDWCRSMADGPDPCLRHGGRCLRRDARRCTGQHRPQERLVLGERGKDHAADARIPVVQHSTPTTA